MPIYEYYCQDCHGVFELMRPARDAAKTQPCPQCDAECPRIVSNFQPFAYRDGFARRLPDNGQTWKVGRSEATMKLDPAGLGKRQRLQAQEQTPAEATAVPSSSAAPRLKRRKAASAPAAGTARPKRPAKRAAK